MGAEKLNTEDLAVQASKMVLSSKEAMQYVGWGRTKFWNLVHSGEIKGRLDGHWKFDRAELDKYKKRTLQR